MKMINSMAALVIYGLSVSLFATVNEAEAGEYDFYVGVHRAAAVGSPGSMMAAIEEGDLVGMVPSERPFTATVIERAEIAFAAQLALDCASGTQAEWVADDAVYQYALSGIEVKLQVEGRANVAEHLCAMSAVAPEAVAQNIHYFPTLKPDLVYVQYDLVSTDSKGKDSRPLAIIQMQDDQIISFTQLSRSPESLRVVNASM
jgi:hypothetical protein